MFEGATTFDLMKLSISAFTPIIVLIFGFVLNRRLKSIDAAQWQNRKIIEKRIEIYDNVAPDLNKIYCFCRFIGYWKDISPQDMIVTKRQLDKSVNIYRHLLSESFYANYNIFIHTAFTTYTGHGKDALIRSEINNTWGDRRIHSNYNWEGSFDDMFESKKTAPLSQLDEAYLAAMNSFRDCVGLSET